MYARDLLDDVALEALLFVRSNIAIILRYAGALTVLETLIWIVLPGSAILLVSIISSFLTAMFAVAIHRRILSDESQFPPLIDQRLLVFIGVTFAQTMAIGLMAGGLFLAALPAILGVGVGGTLGALLLLPLPVAGILWFASKTLMFFPHSAVTPASSLQFDAVWRMSEGIVLPIALRLAAFTGASLLVFYVLRSVLPPATSIQEGLSARLAVSPVYMLETCLFYLTSACLVALASMVYRRVVDGLEMQAQSPGPHTEPGA